MLKELDLASNQVADPWLTHTESLRGLSLSDVGVLDEASGDWCGHGSFLVEAAGRELKYVGAGLLAG
jgi:hypothetical protein